jgi:hypothetical protein
VSDIDVGPHTNCDAKHTSTTASPPTGGHWKHPCPLMSLSNLGGSERVHEESKVHKLTPLTSDPQGACTQSLLPQARRASQLLAPSKPAPHRITSPTTGTNMPNAQLLKSQLLLLLQHKVTLCSICPSTMTVMMPCGFMHCCATYRGPTAKKVNRKKDNNQSSRTPLDEAAIWYA